MKIDNVLTLQQNTVVALGSFDGVHKGHREVLKAAVGCASKKGASSIALCLLPPHPCELIENDDLRRKHIEQSGIDICYQLEFSNYHNITATDFISELLIKKLGCKAVVCGEDFRFGHKRQGDVAMLRQVGEQYGIEVVTANRIDENGEKISSTRIRNSLKWGEIEQANSMLGRHYCINYPVKRGYGIGEKLGFPTINQYWPQGYVVPKNGVYITSVKVDGILYPSATGVTTRPTFSVGKAVSCETTIAAKLGDLYGKKIELFFHEYLFEAKRFDDTAELAAMVADVCQQSKDYFSRTAQK